MGYHSAAFLIGKTEKVKKVWRSVDPRTTRTTVLSATKA